MLVSSCAIAGATAAGTELPGTGAGTGAERHPITIMSGLDAMEVRVRARKWLVVEVGGVDVAIYTSGGGYTAGGGGGD